MGNNEGEERISEQFCDPNADITFRSCDNVLFKIYGKYLEANTEGFPPIGQVATTDEVVQLTETSVTLEFLFKFISPQRNPKLEGLDFAVLAPLAEATQKYQVYHALDVCEAYMSKVLPDHPLEILSYAARHGFPDLLNEAALLLIGMPQDVVVSAIPPHLCIPWLCYYQKWINVLRTASTPKFDFRFHDGYVGFGGIPFQRDCTQWGSLCAVVLSHLGGNVGSLQDLDKVFSSISPDNASCRYCPAELVSWRKEVERELLTIPKFSTFL